MIVQQVCTVTKMQVQVCNIRGKKCIGQRRFFFGHCKNY